MPSRARRLCLTMWLSGPTPGAPPAARPVPPHLSSAWGHLLAPHLRLHTTRLLLAAEWEQSLWEGHAAGPQTEAAVVRHHAEVHALFAYTASVELSESSPTHALPVTGIDILCACPVCSEANNVHACSYCR